MLTRFTWSTFESAVVATHAVYRVARVISLSVPHYGALMAGIACARRGCGGWNVVAYEILAFFGTYSGAVMAGHTRRQGLNQAVIKRECRRPCRWVRPVARVAVGAGDEHLGNRMQRAAGARGRFTMASGAIFHEACVVDYRYCAFKGRCALMANTAIGGGVHMTKVLAGCFRAVVTGRAGADGLRV